MDELNHTKDIHRAIETTNDGMGESVSTWGESYDNESAPMQLDSSEHSKRSSQSQRQGHSEPHHGGEIIWSSLVPSPCAIGITELPADEAFESIAKRVRRECQYLCLLPLQDFQGINDDKSVPAPKSTREWLRCVLSFVSSCLNLDSPNPIGWDWDRNGDVGSYWIIGGQGALRGPQPWQATRYYIATKVYELLEAEGYANWISSDARREALWDSMKLTIEKALSTWKVALGEKENYSLLQEYARLVWERFSLDYLEMLDGISAASVPLHALSERYIRLVAKKLETIGKLKAIPPNEKSPADEGGQGLSSKNELRSILLKKVRKLQYEYFPLMQNNEHELKSVCDRIWDRLIAMTPDDGMFGPLVSMSDVSSTKKVASILNDLEDEEHYLSRLNCLFKVRVCLSELNSVDDVENQSNVDSLSSEKNKNGKVAFIPKQRLCAPRNSGETQQASESRWELSTTKEIDSRVYAHSKQGDWFWGHIIGVTGKKKVVRKEVVGASTNSTIVSNESDSLYTVIFDDGDVIEGLKSNDIITEAQYKVAFGTNPPSPPTGRNKTKRARILSTNDQALAISSVASSDNESQKQPQKDDNSGSIALDPYALQKARCDSCILCKMPDCGRCFVCVSNDRKTFGPSEGCCFRKMCCSIPEESKMQPAIGFPDGWKFIFMLPSQSPDVSNLVPPTCRVISVTGLKLFSPMGEKHNSLSSALANVWHGSVDSTLQSMESFLSHVGSPPFVLFPEHFLVGKAFLNEFTNAHNQPILAYGNIVACIGGGDREAFNRKNKDKTKLFLVKYNQDVLAISKSMGSNMQPIQLITPELAWGGCIAYERKTQLRQCNHSVIRNIDQATACETWLTPEMRLEEIIDQAADAKLPRLTLIARGYKFVFDARISSHEGKSRYGMFVTCTPLKGIGARETDADELSIKPGELIDLGVFSPSRDDDRKSFAAFIAKNYIHSLRCGRWSCSGSGDNIVYDVTDDISGELHEEATQRIYPYIRRCSKDEPPTIHVRSDPSGHIHYLFGISYRGNWDEYENGMGRLIPLFSGNEMEVTLSHGFRHEKKSDIESKHLKAIAFFNPEDIMSCTRLLQRMFSNIKSTQNFPSKVIRRSLEIVKCLDERARILMKNSLNFKLQQNARDCPSIGILDLSLQSLQDIASSLKK